MRTFCYLVAAGALLAAAPAITGQAKAQQAYGAGGGYTNIWSSAQGTSDSYGAASAFDQSISGSMATAGGAGSGGFGGGGVTSSFTTSIAGTSSYGSGYAQAQTSGYAGGSASGYGGRGR
jgi:hypothetical protein